MKVSKQFFFDMNPTICEEAKMVWERTAGTVVDDNDYVTVDEFLVAYRSLKTKDKYIKHFYDTIENDYPDKWKQCVENASEFMKAMADKGVTEDFIAEELFRIYPEYIKELVTTKYEDITDEQIKRDHELIWGSQNHTRTIRWFFDKTIPGTKKVVEYWNEHFEDNDWTFKTNIDEEPEIISNMTKDEMKQKVYNYIASKIGTYEEATDMEPVKYDSRGGVIQDSSLEDAKDDDTFHLTNYLGEVYAFDGREKSLEKAKEMWKEMVNFQAIDVYIQRKISEPDGYFYWREENLEDYL